MLIKLYSAMGQPVHPDHKTAFKKEMNDAMDALEAEHGKPNRDNVTLFSDKLEPLHTELMVKYPISIEENLPTTKKAFKALCTKYDTAIAFCMEDGELVGYVMDEK